VSSQDYWDEYWQQGHITSFGSELPNNYVGELKEFWQSNVIELPAGSKILDLCSGNGALPKLFLESNKSLDITATDLANLDQVAVKTNITSKNKDALVKVLGRVDCTDLPFEACSFDVVTSQFGIEYSDICKTISQISRVLIDGGELLLVTHVDDSRFIKQNSQTKRFLEKITDFDFAKRLFDLAEAKFNNTPIGLSEQNQIDTFVVSIRNEYPQDFKDLYIESFVSMVQSQSSISEVNKLVVLFTNQITSYLARLTDLVNAALSEAKLKQVLAHAESLGLHCVYCQKLTENNQILGQKLKFVMTKSSKS